MGAFGFDNMIFTLQQWGVIDVILPFILIFTIIFAVMEKTQILGKDQFTARKYASVIGLVVAFAVVVPHVTGNYYYGFNAVEVINNALPQVGLLLVAIVMMLITIGLWTGEKADGSKGIGVWFTAISVIIVVGIFIASMGWWNVPNWLWWGLNSELISLIIAILVFGAIVWFISRGEPDKKDKKDRYSIKADLGEFFSGGK